MTTFETGTDLGGIITAAADADAANKERFAAMNKKKENMDAGLKAKMQKMQQAMEKLFWVDDGVDPLVARLKKSRECKSRGSDDSTN